jgi:hypothetical protein
LLTIFSIPKPFTGRIELIQRNAIRSWSALGSDVQVVLVGDEDGTAAAAAALGVEHVGGVGQNELGTPRLDDAFARVAELAAHPLQCFVNADIVLLDDFMPAVRRAWEFADPFLMVGRTLDLAVEEILEPVAGAELRRRALAEGRSRGATAIDYFVFSEGLFDPMPAFVVGRARFDNWLVWRARQRGPVVDASRAVVAVHQTHDYGHMAGGLQEAHFGAEAERNFELAGGRRRIYTIHDATHVLRPGTGVSRNLGSVLRVRETLRKLLWKLRAR